MTTWRDRNGNLHEHDDDTPDHWCRDGLEDANGQIVVCRRCRPELATPLERQREKGT